MVHYKKRFSIFPSSAGMSLTKLSLGGNNLIYTERVYIVSDIPAGDGNIAKLFLQCTVRVLIWCWMDALCIQSLRNNKTTLFPVVGFGSNSPQPS
jgi:hypothetical protein